MNGLLFSVHNSCATARDAVARCLGAGLLRQLAPRALLDQLDRQEDFKADVVIVDGYAAEDTALLPGDVVEIALKPDPAMRGVGDGAGQN